MRAGSEGRKFRRRSRWSRKEEVTRFTEIVLTPPLTLAKGAVPERAVLDKSKTACPVTASLAVPVRLEVEIVVEAWRRNCA